jgi:hypothetical protein
MTHPDSPPVSTVTSMTDSRIWVPREIRNLVAGGVAGMIAKTLVAPIDRIKILYQITATKFRLRDIPRVVHGIVSSEGLAALW